MENKLAIIEIKEVIENGDDSILKIEHTDEMVRLLKEKFKIKRLDKRRIRNIITEALKERIKNESKCY